MAEQDREILWRPSERQGEFLAAPEEEVLYGGAAGGGKLLPLTTELPTPRGFVTMGEVKVGDELFDERGQVCRVVEAFPIEPTPELIRLEFDDGSAQVACVDHKWLTFDSSELAGLTRRNPEWREARRAKREKKAGGKKSEAFTAAISARNSAAARGSPPPAGTVRTTREIAQTLKTASGRTNHAVPVAGDLDLPEADLPLDPYLLGCWLGDGTSAAGSITSMDPEILGAFEAKYRRGATQTKPGNKAVTVGFNGLRQDLVRAGVFRNKHIPMAFLRASYEQRLALLQGLMDTDGTVARDSGSAEFCTTNEAIAEGVDDLIASLGWKGLAKLRRARLRGEDCGPKWMTKFMPSEIVFRLERKARLQRKATRRTCRFRYIVSAEPVASQPGRCIAVDSPSRLFLAGRQMVPTHNSDALVIDALGAWQDATSVKDYRAILFRRTYPELRDLIDRAREIYEAAIPGTKYDGNDKIFKFPSGAIIEFGHMNHPQVRFKYRGRQFAYIGWDELTLYPDDVCYRYLFSRLRSPNTSLKCLVRATTNPDGPGHKWVKERWAIANDGASTNFKVEVRDEETGEVFTRRRRFIRALLNDNPYLRDTEYRIELLQLPPDEREALLRGRWDGIPVRGAFYAEDIKKARREGRIGIVPYQKGVPVDTYWDLGINDTTTIIYHQVVGAQDRIIAAYENSGEALDHYAAEIMGRGWIYGTHHLPHDADYRRLGQTQDSTRTWKAMLEDLLPGHRFETVPRVEDVALGIQQTRNIFGGLWIDEANCSDAIAAWENYRREWDEKLQVYRDRPLHDWASNYSDALRQLGQKRADNLQGSSSGGYRRREAPGARSWKTR